MRTMVMWLAAVLMAGGLWSAQGISQALADEPAAPSRATEVTGSAAGKETGGSEATPPVIEGEPASLPPEAGEVQSRGGDDFPPPPSGLAYENQSFGKPSSWSTANIGNQDWGWMVDPLKSNVFRLLADVNNDGRADIVGFGNDGVYVALSTGTKFGPAYKKVNDFGVDQGWRTGMHVRLMADVNRDGYADIVAFGNAGVWTALSTRLGGFNPPRLVLANFGFNQRWEPKPHPRLIADVDADGCPDIVAFGSDGVWTALGKCDGSFAEAKFKLPEFGAKQGWSSTHIRLLADVNNDGRADIVAANAYWIFVSLATSDGGFAKPLAVQPVINFGNQQVWNLLKHFLYVADVNKDGHQDLVSIDVYGVWVALGYSNGYFGPVQMKQQGFGYKTGWGKARVNPRFVVDLNRDGYADIVGYGDDAVYRTLGGGPVGLSEIREMFRSLVAGAKDDPDSDGSGIDPGLQFVADVNGDGMPDLVVFTGLNVMVALSSDLPPPPPPQMPSNPQITSTGSTSVNLAWKDNSQDERRFLVTFWPEPAYSVVKFYVGANVTSYSQGASPDTSFCFRVQAESFWGFSQMTDPPVCARTGPTLCGPGEGCAAAGPISLNVCGLVLLCQSGYHPIRYLNSTSCPVVDPSFSRNQTMCYANSASPSFDACGVANCPVGWHSSRYFYKAECKTNLSDPSLIANANYCEPDTGSFEACRTCPSGYRTTILGQSNRCGADPVVRCDRCSGGVC